MKKVRIGIVGVGGMGQGHIASLKDVPEAQLTAVADIDAAVAKEVGTKAGVPWFTDHRKLVDSGLVDAVLVATPHYFHPEISIYAMEHGLHALSEKPIAVTVSQADAMVAAAKKTRKVFAVMHQMRSLPEIIAARKIIEDGRLGEIQRTVLMEPNYRSQAYYDSGTWRATWAGEGGGVIMNQAPHCIDLFILFGGLPKKIEAKWRTRLHKIEVDDEVSAVLEYKNGAWGYYYTCTNEIPRGVYMEIAGNKGKLVYRNGQLQFFSIVGDLKEFTFKNKEMWAAPEFKEEKIKLPKVQGSHAAITRNFCRAILYGEKLLSPGMEGLRVVEFINAVLLSGKLGKPVETPVNRRQYDAFLNQLKKKSKYKKIVKMQRITDPNIEKLKK